MTSFLVLLPALFLFLAALGIVILQQVRPSIGYAWLMAAGMGLVTVGTVLFLRWRLPLSIVFEQWRPFTQMGSPPGLSLDLDSWPYVFSLAVLALAFIFTDSARLESEARPTNWAVGLALAGLGMVAVMAARPLTLVLAWTAVDLVELLMVMTTKAGQRMGAQTVTAFSVRVAGTLLVVVAILFARSRGIPFDLTPIPSALAIFMLLAAGLRLGVLPLNLPYTREVYAWRGLGTVMRMIGPASSLAVLGRMPEQAITGEWKGIFLALTALAAIYGAAMWFAARDELTGRPFWFLALAGLAVASVINGDPRASIAWGTSLILSGGLLFFFTARRRQIMFIPALAVLGLVGLPFNPAASGWSGLAAEPFNGFTLLFLLTVLLSGWGYWRHFMRPRDELYRMERWVHTIYPAGLLLLIIAHWVIGVLGWPGSLTVGAWWVSAPLAVLLGLGIVLYYTLRNRWLAGRVDEGQGVLTWRWVAVSARQAGGVLNAVFRLGWLYRFISWSYQILQAMVQVLTAMFEGDGGILWSLVMLALLISLVWAGGVP